LSHLVLDSEEGLVARLCGLQVVLIGRKVYINDRETDGIAKWKGASL